MLANSENLSQNKGLVHKPKVLKVIVYFIFVICSDMDRHMLDFFFKYELFEE